MYGPGTVALSRAVVSERASRELLDDAEPLGRGELLDDLERRVGVPVRLAELARRLERADAVEAVVEADDEAHAAHLSRGQHVDAGALLVDEGGLGGVLDELSDVGGAEAPGLERLAGEPHPSGKPVAPDDRRGQERKAGHGELLSQVAGRPR